MRFRLTILFVVLVLPGSSWAQSPFDGTWIIDSGSIKPSDKPEVYTLNKGEFCCVQTSLGVKADGQDHKVAEGPYVDTENVKVVDDRTVEVIVKKTGRLMFTTTFAVSADENGLTATTKDTTEVEAVTFETFYQRIEKGPAGSHALTGSWRAFKTKRSANSSIIKYKCTAEGFSAETPLGEKYYGKFDGQFYPTEDDPGHTLASVKLIDANTVELTQKRGGKITGVLRLRVAEDGKSIHGVFQSKMDGTRNSFEMQKSASTPPDDSKTDTSATSGSRNATIKPKVTPPSCRRHADPPYTKEALRAKFQGVVRVEVIIELDGSLTNVRIIESPGLGLDESVLKTLKTWKCTPIKVDGRPVRSSVPIEISFRLSPGY